MARISVLDNSAVAHKPLPGISNKVTLRNKTQHFNVYYVTSLGGAGQTIADGVLATCESDYNRISSYFGGITPPGLPFDIFLAHFHLTRMEAAERVIRPVSPARYKQT